MVLAVEDLEGVVLVEGTLRAVPGWDTTGTFVLDTGAGFLAIDRDLCAALGIMDRPGAAGAVDLAARALPRLDLGGLQFDQVSPVLAVDAEVIRRVTGRPVLGLLGRALFRDRVLLLDYNERVLAVLSPDSLAEDGVGTHYWHSQPADSDTAPDAPGHMGGMEPPPLPPALCKAMSSQAVPVPYRLAGDGKLLIHAIVPGQAGAPSARLTLIVDTGATKSVFFRAALARRLPTWTEWPSIEGLAAPTLTGDARAEIVRVPELRLESPWGQLKRLGMDAAVIGGGLGELLATGVGEPVEGLLGYSFLKHFRIALDGARGVLWLDPTRGDVPDRTEEYSHVGLQLECVAGAIRVAAVAERSPAAHAGIKPGDRLLRLDGKRVAGADVVEVARKLEGPPGTSVVLELQRGRRHWLCRLARQRLL